MDWADSASLQSLTLQPLPTFFFSFHSHGSSHGCLPPSLNHSPSISFSHSPPPTHCTPGEPPTSAAYAVTPSLSPSVLSVCLSLSHYFHQSFSLTLSPSPVQWGCSSTLRATGIWQREATNTCLSKLMHTYTNWHFTYRYSTVWFLKCAEPLLKSDCFSTLNSSDLLPHNCWIICLSKNSLAD